MKKLVVLFPLVFMLGACGNKEVISFKGVPLGTANSTNSLMKLCSEEQLNEKVGCKLSGQDIRFVATFGKLDEGNWAARFAGKSTEGAVTPNFTLNDKDEIQSIRIQNIDTSSILATIPLLEEKYGKPKTETRSVRNGFGSEFEQKIFTWKDPEGNTLRVWSIDEKVDKGLIVFLSAAVEAKLVEDKKKSDSAAKSSL